jgi:hypothetical protein
MDEEQLIEAVRQTLAYAKRMRGNTTEEDLVEKLTWRLEGIVETIDAAK